MLTVVLKLKDFQVINIAQESNTANPLTAGRR